MMPGYYICNHCKEKKVKISNRIELFDGYDNLGTPKWMILDLCPTCMARVIRVHVDANVYRKWINAL